MENFLDFCEELGAEVVDVAANAARTVKINWKYIRTQLEALPYIAAACLVCGAFWFITSMLALMCD